MIVVRVLLFINKKTCAPTAARALEPRDRREPHGAAARGPDLHLHRPRARRRQPVRGGRRARPSPPPRGDLSLLTVTFRVVATPSFVRDTSHPSTAVHSERLSRKTDRPTPPPARSLLSARATRARAPHLRRPSTSCATPVAEPPGCPGGSPPNGGWRGPKAPECHALRRLRWRLR